MLINLLSKIFPGKDIGWKEINETFIRLTLLSTPWFKVYLHRLICETIPDHCHDHPWNFRTWILKTGYWEETSEGVFWRKPFTTLYRPAYFAHKVWTKPEGAWSIVFVSKKYREWNKNAACRGNH